MRYDSPLPIFAVCWTVTVISSSMVNLLLCYDLYSLYDNINQYITSVLCIIMCVCQARSMLMEDAH